MARVFFYSINAYNYFKKYKRNKQQIKDYFDIESQKILPTIGYQYKLNPVIIYNNDLRKVPEILQYYNLDTFNLSFLFDSTGKKVLGIIYDCY